MEFYSQFLLLHIIIQCIVIRFPFLTTTFIFLYHTHLLLTIYRPSYFSQNTNFWYTFQCHALLLEKLYLECGNNILQWVFNKTEFRRMQLLYRNKRQQHVFQVAYPFRKQIQFRNLIWKNILDTRNLSFHIFSLYLTTKIKVFSLLVSVVYFMSRLRIFLCHSEFITFQFCCKRNYIFASNSFVESTGTFDIEISQILMDYFFLKLVTTFVINERNIRA